MSKDSEKRPQQPEMSDAELDELTAEGLPDRENMSLVNVNADVPVDAAVSANVLTQHSTATSNAPQHAPQGPVVQR